MVASLQNKKEALEAKLRDKTSELRKLCIEEAELTGILPVETPLEPGESAPAFRRRIGTAYSFPENLINKLRSKEDETLAALELECKIQTGIAEAAKGLASDGTAGKSVRRKHRLLYEDSQRRLSELEARLAAYRQAVPKQKKKPRPHADFDNSPNDGGDIRDVTRYPPPPVQLQDRNQNSSLRHSHTYGGLSKPEYNMHQIQYRSFQSQMHIPAPDYRYSLLEQSQHYIARSNNASPEDHNGTWSRMRELNVNHHHSQLNNTFVYPSTASIHDGNQHETTPANNFVDRFGSLDRNSHYSDTVDSGERISATLPRNSTNPPSVLLPNQTYPESSLMRTQSLGNMDNLKHLPPDRKKECKEKEWYETSLDSSPPIPSSEFSPSPRTADGRLSSPSNASVDMPIENGVARSNQASINSIQFDTVVPYESPKNHTVVQAGKWQPYREVTKPFEMSDFYKYSTKYRQQSKALPTPGHHQPLLVQDTSQQKGVYKAPVMHECQPLSRENSGSAPQSPNKNEYHYQHQLVDHSASTWYRNKGVPKPRSSTLV